MKKEGGKLEELSKNALSIVSIVVVALILFVIFKIKGGILGVVLGTISVVALIYWLMEVVRIFGGQETPSMKESEWFYDVIEDGENVTFTAKVPGPTREVKVKIVGDMLEIKGGGNFMRKVQIPKGARLQEKSYINGVLNIKLQKMETPDKIY